MQNFKSLSLREKLTEIEKTVGTFSAYATVPFSHSNSQSIHAKDIPFDSKPAQQFLTGIGVKDNQNNPLSTKSDGESIAQDGNSNVDIYGFNDFQNTDESNKLIISGGRVDKLVKSAKIYVNNGLVPRGLFQKALEKKSVDQQDKKIVPDYKDLYWQNMAVGICHVQEVDLLVQQKIDNESGKAIAMPRTGGIETNETGILLLSSPALNFAYGTARFLKEEEAKKYIYEMFYNLFYATQAEGRQYIVLPAAGLGAFLPKNNTQAVAGWYFEMLKAAAKEFPKLNVIYHPAGFSKEFKQVFNKLNETPNVVEATKDVVFIADELTKAGFPCGLHNPSDADVVYGVYDVGEYWKKGDFVGEEYLGTMTTAPLNSYGLNPVAYQTVIEHNLSPIQTAKNNIFNILDHVLEAYKTDSKGFDNKSEGWDHGKKRVDWSFFLAHNRRGWNDASRKIMLLKRDIEVLASTIKEEEQFNIAVMDAIKKSIVNNRYSGYKSHSFRHYMHAVAFFKEQQLKEEIQEEIHNQHVVTELEPELEQFKRTFREYVKNERLDKTAAKNLENEMRESQNQWKIN